MALSGAVPAMAFPLNRRYYENLRVIAKAWIRQMGSLMTTFDERENAFEAKLAHDEELKFRAIARRDKKLGLWAAAKLARTGAAAEEYAASLISADVAASGDEDVFKKLRSDFDQAKVEQSDHQIRRKMEEFFAEAVEEIKTGVRD
jgi:hypothetical protein